MLAVGDLHVDGPLTASAVRRKRRKVTKGLLAWTAMKHPRGPGGKFRRTPDRPVRVLARQRSIADLTAAIAGDSFDDDDDDRDPFEELTAASDHVWDRTSVRLDVDHPGIDDGRITGKHLRSIGEGIEKAQELFGRDLVNEAINGSLSIVSLTDPKNPTRIVNGLSTTRGSLLMGRNGTRHQVEATQHVQVDPVNTREGWSRAWQQRKQGVEWKFVTGMKHAKDAHEALSSVVVHELTHAVHAQWEIGRLTQNDIAEWDTDRTFLTRRMRGSRSLGGVMEDAYLGSIAKREEMGGRAAVKRIYALTNRSEWLAENVSMHAYGGVAAHPDTAEWIKMLTHQRVRKAADLAKAVTREPLEVPGTPYPDEPTEEELWEWGSPEYREVVFGDPGDDLSKGDYHPATHPRDPGGRFVSTGGRRPLFASAMLVNQDTPMADQLEDDDSPVLVNSDLVVTKGLQEPAARTLIASTVIMQKARRQRTARLSPEQHAQRVAAGQASAAARRRKGRRSGAVEGYKNYVGPVRHGVGLIAAAGLSAVVLSQAGKTYGDKKRTDPDAFTMAGDPIREEYKDRKGRARYRWKDDTWKPEGKHMRVKLPLPVTIRAATRGRHVPGTIRPAVSLRGQPGADQRLTIGAGRLHGRFSSDDDNIYWQSPRFRDMKEGARRIQEYRRISNVETANRGAFVSEGGIGGSRTGVRAHPILPEHSGTSLIASREIIRRDPKTKRFTQPTRRLSLSTAWEVDPRKIGEPAKIRRYTNPKTGEVGPPSRGASLTHPRTWEEREGRSDEVIVANLMDRRSSVARRTLDEAKGLSARTLIEAHLTGDDATRAARAMNRNARTLTAAAYLGRLTSARNQRARQAQINARRQAGVTRARQAAAASVPGATKRKRNVTKAKVEKHPGAHNQLVHGGRPNVGYGGPRTPIGWKRGGRTGSVQQHHDARGRWTTTGGKRKSAAKKVGRAGTLMAGTLLAGSLAGGFWGVTHRGGSASAVTSPKPKTSPTVEHVVIPHHHDVSVN